jgi:hypothetical protein
MPFYITLLALFLLYGCSSRTIVVNKNDAIKKNQVIITSSSLPSISTEEIIISEENIVTQPPDDVIVSREPFTPLPFRKIMKDLDHILFVDLDIKLSKGEDWIEYNKSMKNTLQKFIKKSRELKKFKIIKDDEEAMKSIKKLITYGYILDDLVKNRKFDYVKPAFDKTINVCNKCHDRMM